MSRAYKDRFVCFIDLMGISAGVLTSETSRSPFLRRTKNALDDVSNRIRRDHVSSGSKEIRFEYISDSIFLVSEDSSQESFAQVLFCCQDVCATFLKHGFFARGGIAMGKTYSYQRTLLGEATVKAVNLEKSVAQFPRVVLGREARLKLGEDTIFQRLVEQANEGPFWVNTLEYFSSQLTTGREHSHPDTEAALDSLRKVAMFIENGIDEYRENLKVWTFFNWYRDYYLRSFEPLVREYGSKIVLPSNMV